MSSYFDTMQQCLADPNRLAELVFTQYRAYMRELQDEVLKADEEKLSELTTRLYTIQKKFKDNKNPSMMIDAIHSLAHDVGRATIHLKGGRIAGDNPRLVY